MSLHYTPADPSNEEFLISRALVQGSNDVSCGIPQTSVQGFLHTLLASPSSTLEASILGIFQQFARNSPSGHLAVDDFGEFCAAIAPLLEMDPNDMHHSHVTGTYIKIFLLLADDTAETPGSGGSVQAQERPSSDAAGGVSVRKEDLREYLEGTMCADGRPLMAANGMDLSNFLRERGRRNEVFQDDFIAVMNAALRGGRLVDPSALTDSVVERRRQRREGKKKAMEKIKAAMMTNLQENNLGVELRAAASPPRRRAVSPYAFGSWKMNQGAVSPLLSSPATDQPPSSASQQVQPPATYQPIAQIPSPRDRPQMDANKKPSSQPPTNQPPPSSSGSKSVEFSNVSFSDIPMISVDLPPQGAVGSSTASYDFSAHNAILDDTFALLDVNEEGSLPLNAIYELCAAFPNAPPQNAIRRLFHLVDVDASNGIDREEFEQLCFLLQQKTALTVTDMCNLYTTSMYRRLFELLDEDGDGDDSVSREELRVLLEAISPILQATFSSSDVYRLTKEYETDQLDFPQFQAVVKSLIRGRSISKVVSAFEEVLRRRRLLKRTALEKFASFSIQPSATPGKKLPPPPSGPPPQKTCHKCPIQSRRILELEEQVAALESERDALELQVKAARTAAAAAPDVKIVPLRGNTVLQWFDAVAEADHQRASEVLSTTSVHPVGCELLEAFGGAYSNATNPLHLFLADPTICPLLGDRSIWADCTFSPMCNGAAETLKELNDVVVHSLLPLFEDVVCTVQPVIYTLQAIVADTDAGCTPAHDHLEALRDQAAALALSRNSLAVELSKHQRASNTMRKFAQQRSEIAGIALLQLTTSSAMRVKSSKGSEHVGSRSPRGGSSVANTGQHVLHKTVQDHLPATTSSQSYLPQLYAAGTAAVATFLQFMTAIGSSPLDAELLSARILKFSDAALREEDAQHISDLFGSFAAISRRLTAGEWSRAEQSARSTLDEIKQAVYTSVNSSKRDKSVMVCMEPVNEDSKRPVGGGENGREAGRGMPHQQAQTSSAAVPPRALQSLKSGGGTSPDATQTARHRARSSSLARNAAGPSVVPEVPSYLQHAHEYTVHSASPRVRSRRERPVNVRLQLDRLLEEFLQQWRARIPSNFGRTDPATNVFYFGTKKLELMAMDNFIVVKVGGGYLLLEEFCEKYAAVEVRRWNAFVEKSTSADGAVARRSASPACAAYGLVFSTSTGSPNTHSTGVAAPRTVSTSRATSAPRAATPMRGSAVRTTAAHSPA